MMKWFRDMRYMLEIFIMHKLIMYYFDRIEEQSRHNIAKTITRTGTFLQQEQHILFGKEKEKDEQ